MNIPTVVIEREARIGDTWRKRYPSLTLHSARTASMSIGAARASCIAIGSFAGALPLLIGIAMSRVWHPGSARMMRCGSTSRVVSLRVSFV